MLHFRQGSCFTIPGRLRNTTEGARSPLAIASPLCWLSRSRRNSTHSRWSASSQTLVAKPLLISLVGNGSARELQDLHTLLLMRPRSVIDTSSRIHHIFEDLSAVYSSLWNCGVSGQHSTACKALAFVYFLAYYRVSGQHKARTQKTFHNLLFGESRRHHTFEYSIKRLSVQRASRPLIS